MCDYVIFKLIDGVVETIVHVRCSFLLLGLSNIALC